MAVTWDYNGSTTVTADTTFDTADEAAGLLLECDEPNDSLDTGGGSLGDPVTLTAVGIGSLSAGDLFVAELSYTDSLTTRHATKEAQLFTYGTADTGIPYAFEFDYDGNTTVTFTLPIDTLISTRGITVACSDPDSSAFNDGSPGAAGGTASGSITDIGGLSPGDKFAMAVSSGSPGFYGVFDVTLTFGSPSSGGGGDPVEIPVTAITRTGVTEPAQTDSTTDGMFLSANDGSIYIEIESTDAAEQTLSFALPALIDGEPLEDRTVTVPAGETRVAGPWPVDLYDQEDGSVLITASVDSTLKLRAYSLPFE